MNRTMLLRTRRSMRILFICLILIAQTYVLRSSVPSWSVVPNAFQYDMTLASRVMIGCNDTNSRGVVVGAFVNGQCRGVDSNVVLIDGAYSTFITIRSNVQIGEKVVFQMYDPITDSIYNALDTVDFEHNKALSKFTYPYLLMSNYKPEKIGSTATSIVNILPVNTIIADLTTVDKNNTTFLYSIVPTPGLNSDYFSISGNSLVIQKLLISDTSKKLRVKIQTNDLLGCTLDSVFTFDVVNSDPPPTGLVASDSVIFEHAPFGTLARKLIAKDASVVDSHVYELVDGLGAEANPYFKIEGDRLLVNAVLEYSSAAVLPVRIRITDRARNALEVMTKIVLREYVYTIKPSANVIDEHVPLNTVAKQLDIEDPDNSGPYTMSLVAGEGSQDNYRYAIANNNQLIVNTDIEYDSAILHHVRVAVVNSFGNKIEYKLNVDILETINSTQPLKVNNLMTPNGDGSNDFFEIQNVYLYKDFTLTIMDDNGSIVMQYFPSKPYNNDWNGLSSTGVKLPNGMYYYYFNNASNEHVFKGTIYLMQP